MSNLVTQTAGGGLYHELKAQFREPAVRQRLGAVLPKGLDYERFTGQALTLLQKNPGLLDCTVASMLSGMVQAGELGLDLSGVLGQAYLVPRYNGKKRCKEATFQVGYRGLIDLAYRSPRLASFEIRTVYASDFFRYHYGSDSRVEHRPYEGPDDPGPATHYYAVAHFQGGGKDFEVMSRARAEQHRAKFSPKGRYDSAWDTSFDAMAAKTVAIKLSKRLPLCVELQKASVLSEYNEAGVPAEGAGDEAAEAGKTAASILDALPEPEGSREEGDGAEPASS